MLLYIKYYAIRHPATESHVVSSRRTLNAVSAKHGISAVRLCLDMSDDVVDHAMRKP